MSILQPFFLANRHKVYHSGELSWCISWDTFFKNSFEYNWYTKLQIFNIYYFSLETGYTVKSSPQDNRHIYLWTSFCSVEVKKCWSLFFFFFLRQIWCPQAFLWIPVVRNQRGIEKLLFGIIESKQEQLYHRVEFVLQYRLNRLWDRGFFHDSKESDKNGVHQWCISWLHTQAFKSRNPGLIPDQLYQSGKETQTSVFSKIPRWFLWADRLRTSCLKRKQVVILMENVIQSVSSSTRVPHCMKQNNLWLFLKRQFVSS